MHIWLPISLYKIKPLFLLVVGILILMMTVNKAAIALAIAMVGYAIWIYIMRFIWKDTGMVN